MRNGLNRINICTKSPWESAIGYSRVVHLNPFVYVSGTTATDEKGIIVGLDDPYIQTVQSLKNIETALQAAGVRLKDVVRSKWGDAVKGCRDAIESSSYFCPIILLFIQLFY